MNEMFSVFFHDFFFNYSFMYPGEKKHCHLYNTKYKKNC